MSSHIINLRLLPWESNDVICSDHVAVAAPI